MEWSKGLCGTNKHPSMQCTVTRTRVEGGIPHWNTQWNSDSVPEIIEGGMVEVICELDLAEWIGNIMWVW